MKLLHFNKSVGILMIMKKYKFFITISVSLLCVSNIVHADYLMKFTNSQSIGLIPEKQANSSVSSSCKEILDSGKSTGNGVYTISVNSNEFDVYCDMTSAGGGWTMVVAQFEQDPVSNWNEGIQADYDPTLVSAKGFALNSQQIPAHTETAFGKNKIATDIDAVTFNYTTGPIPLTVVASNLTGTSYHINRNLDSHYVYHNPDEFIGTNNPEWYETLTFDETVVRGHNWAFGPNVASPDVRGYAHGGSKISSTSESFAWTVWVR